MGPGADFLSFLLPLIIISVPFAIGFGYLAKALEKNVVVWVIISLIPLVNYFFWIYAMFVTLLFILENLKDIRANMAARNTG